MTTQLDLSALIDDNSGKLGRAAPIPIFDVPNHVEANDRGQLIYGYRPDRPIKVADPASALARSVLGDFIEIGSPTVKASGLIDKFAKTWGPLGLCEHRLPASHNRAPRQWLGVPRQWWCEPDGFRDLEHQRRCRGRYGAPELSSWGRERLRDWVTFAELARSAVSIQASLMANQAPKPSDVGRLLGTVYAAAGTVRVQIAVAEIVSDWLSWAGITPELSWEEESRDPLTTADGGAFAMGLANGWRHHGSGGGPTSKWRLVYRVNDVGTEIDESAGIHVLRDAQGGGIFGVIAVQLALMVLNADLVAICAGCFRIFKPKRLPRRDERQWCPREDCQRAARAVAASAYRRRKKPTPEASR